MLSLREQKALDRHIATNTATVTFGIGLMPPTIISFTVIFAGTHTCGLRRPTAQAYHLPFSIALTGIQPTCLCSERHGSPPFDDIYN